MSTWSTQITITIPIPVFTILCFIAQLTKIYLGGRMLGFLPICGQFGENNELFVLTSYLPFFFYFSHWNYPYRYLWNCFFLSNSLWLFYLFLFNCLSGRHPLWIIGPSPSSSSFHDSPSQSNCLVTIGRKLVEDKVNHRERQGKASLKLATNHWRQQEATKKENMKNPQVIHYACMGRRWRSVWTNFDGENMQRGKCFTLQSESGQFAYFPTHLYIFQTSSIVFKDNHYYHFLHQKNL